MFRRVVQSISGIAKSMAQKPTTTNILPSNIPSSSNLYDHSHMKSTDHENAFADLREAVRELSTQSQSYSQINYFDTKELLEWNSKPLTELSTSQLEELARAYYEGTDGGIDQSVFRAVEIWREASQRGSVEAKYSLAVCYREGKGLATDSTLAFEMMNDLATNYNYHLAHYAVGIMFSRGEGITVDHVTAFHSFKTAAKCGVMPALHNIANCYAAGQGVKQSDYNALLYYEAAVDAGDPSAKFSLGNWYYQGRQVKQDRSRAFNLQVEAAQAGHPGAMFNVGAHYMSGEGISRDLTKAGQWFEKSAELGFIQAAINLGNMCRHGHGVPKDPEKAYRLFSRHEDRNELCRELATEVLIELKESKI